MTEHAKTKPDLTDAWDNVRAIGEPARAQDVRVPVYYPRVPRWTHPYFAAFFVALCGIMAFILFNVGKFFGGLLFSSVVAVGVYVLYNNVRAWRAARALNKT